MTNIINYVYVLYIYIYNHLKSYINTISIKSIVIEQNMNLGILLNNLQKRCRYFINIIKNFNFNFNQSQNDTHIGIILPLI